MDSASHMIAIERLSKTFETSRGTSHLALPDISLDVAQGEFVSVLGPSGCGKSTLLYIVGGFVTPSAGTLKVADKPVTGPGPDRGPVFQEFALFPRSEEHTSELQSLAYLVCRLLLEKKI